MSLSREEWLEHAAKKIEQQIISKHGVTMPEVWKVSVGFPSVSKAIGQAWDKEASKDEKTHHMFISPVLGTHDIVNLLQVLLHEQIHLCVGVDQKHGGEFKRVARAVGLEGRLTATYVSDDSELANQLMAVYNEMCEEYGDYPHITLVPKLKEKKERKRNIVKLVSPIDSEFIIKVNKAQIETKGMPKDYEGNEMEYLDE